MYIPVAKNKVYNWEDYTLLVVSFQLHLQNSFFMVLLLIINLISSVSVAYVACMILILKSSIGATGLRCAAVGVCRYLAEARADINAHYCLSKALVLEKDQRTRRAP